MHRLPECWCCDYRHTCHYHAYYRPAYYILPSEVVGGSEAFCYWHAWFYSSRDSPIIRTSSDLCHRRSCYNEASTFYKALCLPKNGITPTACWIKHSWTQPVIFHFYLYITTPSFILVPPVVLWTRIYIISFLFCFLAYYNSYGGCAVVWLFNCLKKILSI